MIKQLKKNDAQTSPFIGTKNWSLLNVQHQDLVLLEMYSSSLGPPTSSVVIPDTFVALEFIDYSLGVPEGVLNRDCNIALEQQVDDPVFFEEGISGSGFFYPSDAQNPNGSYKRLVFHEILNAFYNSYQNPLKMFGLEKIDFQSSETQKYLSNYFRVFSLDQTTYGDKITPGTIEFVDNTFDDNYTVRDDAKGNLFAYPNLFSKVQEVRHIENAVFDGFSTYICPPPQLEPPDPPYDLTASISGACDLPYEVDLTWSYAGDISYVDQFDLYRSLTLNGVNWTPFSYLASTPADTLTYKDSVTIAILSASYYVSAENAVGESTGSNIATVYTTCSFAP